jgi:hypothetical protein
MGQISTQPYPFIDTQDEVSGSLVTVDFAHHEIHEGDSFTYDDLITTPSKAKKTA